MRRRRNPRSVPLDIYDPGTKDPYPFPFHDTSLSSEEQNRRWHAIQAASDDRARTSSKRRDAAAEEYMGIYMGILNLISSNLSKIRLSGVLDVGPSVMSWPDLGKSLAAISRDFMALDYTYLLARHHAFLVEPSLYVPRAWAGRKSGVIVRVGAVTMRDYYERAASLIERWILARVAFESKPWVASDRSFRGLGDLAEARKDLIKADRSISMAQASMVNGHLGGANQNAETADESFASLLTHLGMSDVADSFAHVTSKKWKYLEAKVKAAEKLAARKGPGRVSRKHSMAEEARIAASEQARGNPFAGYRDFASCVRAKSRDPKVYSPGGVCATIERRSKRKINPVQPVDPRGHVSDIVESIALENDRDFGWVINMLWSNRRNGQAWAMWKSIKENRIFYQFGRMVNGKNYIPAEDAIEVKIVDRGKLYVSDEDLKRVGISGYQRIVAMWDSMRMYARDRRRRR